MRDLDRHVKGWALCAVVLYGLMYAGFSYIQLDPRPSAWLTGVVERRYDMLCGYRFAAIFPRNQFSAVNCARDLREDGMLLALFLPIPLSVLIGSLLIVLTRLGAGALIIRSSSPLCGTVRKGFETVKREPALLALPAAASVAVSLLLGFVFWRAFSDPRAAELNRTAAAGLAWAVILSPAVLIAYFAVAFAALQANAVLIHGYLVHAAGGRPRLRDALAAAARVAPAVFVLSFGVFGALLLLSMLVYSARSRFLSYFDQPIGWAAGETAKFAVFFLESGLLITTQLVVAAMISEKIGMREAISRVSSLIKPAGREVLTAAFGMATMRHEACLAALIGPMMAMYLMVPVFVENITLWTVCTLTVGIMCGALYFSFLMALEAVFAAGIYVYATSGKVLPGLERDEIDAFLNGLRKTAAGV